MRHHSRARLGTVMALVVSLAALIPAGGAAAATHLVDMDNGYSFHPATKTIARGDTVKWRNKGAIGHDVKSNLSGYFVSPGGEGGMGEDKTYSHTFKQAGSFGYLCREHEDDMRGTIKVPISVSRNGNTFTITAASATQTGKWRNRIQVKKDGSNTWTTIAVTTARSVNWGTTQGGEFRFRSAVKNSQTGAVSGYSPTVTKTK